MADLERGKRIKGLRKDKAERLGRKVTQPQMAEFVGVTLRAAQEWEYGGGIDDEHLPKLLEFLETDANYLLRGMTPDLMGEMNGDEPEQEDEPALAPHQAQLDRIEKKLDEILERLRRDEGGEGPPGPLPDEPPGPLGPSPQPNAPSEDEPPTDQEERQRPA